MSFELSRRDFIRLCAGSAAAISLSGYLAPFWTAQAAGPGSAVPDHITLSWISDPTTTMAITWRTDSQTKNTIVQYAPSNGTILPANAASESGLVNSFSTNIGIMNIHLASLNNLQPGTSYLYRVGDGKNWSNIYRFKTEALNSNKLTAVIFGDSQSGAAGSYNYKPWNQILTSAVNREKPDFAVNVGDLVEVGHDQKQWEAWYSAIKGTMESIPLMPVVGNHETFLLGESGNSKPTYFTAQFTVPNNGPTGLKGQAYSYDYGPVHFVVLDSQGQEEGAQILNEQKSWLDQDLKATKQPWKIAFFHKSPYWVKISRANNDVRAAFCSILEQNHVDLVINGHDHTVERTYPILNGNFLSSPSKSTVYTIAGRSGAKIYTDVQRKTWSANFYDPTDQPNYMLLQVDGSKLQLTAKKANDSIIDSFWIDKASDTFSTNELPKTGKSDITKSPQPITSKNSSKSNQNSIAANG